VQLLQFSSARAAQLGKFFIHRLLMASSIPVLAQAHVAPSATTGQDKKRLNDMKGIARIRRQRRRDFMKIIPISLGDGRRLHRADLWFWACNPGRPWWRKPDLITDLCYWLFIPVITRYFRIGMLIAGAAVLFHITTADGLIAFYENGHGPLASAAARRPNDHLSSSARISSPTGRIAFSRRTSCGSTTPCIIPRKNWNGSRRRVSIRSICSSAP
jgi:hypothetical protein